MSLVDVVDQVLALLEADDRMRFTLDGQLATVDDYLEIRPEAEERIRALVRSGRLAIGPWQTLVDEFLVSGETICRNLEVGLARAEELGGAMRVGYLPDSFGHIAQMPQILRNAGIETAVVWRGVPSQVQSHAFAWAAPDGSTVRTEYLPEGYGNAAYVFEAPDADLDPLEERLRPWFDGAPVLAMVGTDHMPPVHGLPDRIPEGARIGTIAEYLETVEPLQQTVTSWDGELRSGARANLLPNVVSARIDLKQACARAERSLERYAEPLQALWGDEWPERFLAEAWSRMLQNAAHDSICGCSADEVSAQVLVRYAEAEQIGNELTRRVVERIASDAPRGSVVVVNPSPFSRTDVVELDLPIPEDWETVALETPDGSLLPTQEIRRHVPLLWEKRLSGSDVVGHIRRRLHGRELFGCVLNGYTVSGDAVTLEVADDADPEWLDVEELLGAVELATAEGEWTLRIEAQPRRVLVGAVSAPPLGYTTVRAVRDERPGTGGGIPAPFPSVRIVRGRDVGDSYNYAAPEDDVLVEFPEDEQEDLLEQGPVRTVVQQCRSYRWDARLVEVDTRLELRLHEPFVRVQIAFDNPCGNQRVRAHIPLREAVDTSRAEGQFAVVERGRCPEGGYGEVPLGTYPASSFVAAGGIALLLEHVTEYELLEDELALTVLRSTGLISRSSNPYREDPAGPEVPIPAAQMRGPHTFSFAWCPDPEHALTHAEQFRLPFATAHGRSRDGELRERAGPELSGAVLSSLRRHEDGLEARIANMTGSPVSARFGDAVVELRPWEIRNVRLRREHAEPAV